MVKKYVFLLLFLPIFMQPNLHAQEIKIFKSTDFDLKGKVKKCLVRTDYGKEEYEFNEEGLLTKSITRYNEQDYDITHYKYLADELLEKRLEVYRDNVFDKITSIANFYTIDTTVNRKITEKIISYSKEFLGQYEYFYDNEGRLIRINHNDNEGSDETEIIYKNVEGEQTKTMKRNGTILQSVRTSQRKGKDQKLQTIILTKNFIDGQPNKAVEEIKNESGLPVSKTEFYFDSKTKQFVPDVAISFGYDENNMLSKTEAKRGAITEVKEFIYQFDGTVEGNWVKEIVTPVNTYKTREISYYQTEKLVVEE